MQVSAFLNSTALPCTRMRDFKSTAGLLRTITGILPDDFSAWTRQGVKK